MHPHGGPEASGVLLPIVLVLGLGYAVLLAHAGPHRWPTTRMVATASGLALTLWALLGPLAGAAHDSFTAHMAQHLIVGMLAPYLIVLGAPVTLLLRAGSPGWRRGVTALLHTPYLRLLANPVVALLLSVGTLPVLYGTGLYAVVGQSSWLHAALHVHFFVSGYLFAWVICGPDPGPSRPSVPWRLVLLGVAVLVHATMSQLIYAGLTPVPADAADLRRGATLMYYGGDLIELALAVTLVTQWQPARRRPQAVTARG